MTTPALPDEPTDYMRSYEIDAWVDEAGEAIDALPDSALIPADLFKRHHRNMVRFLRLAEDRIGDAEAERDDAEEKLETALNVLDEHKHRPELAKLLRDLDWAGVGDFPPCSAMCEAS